MASLIDQESKKERQLVKAVTVIGRAEHCDVCVPKSIVSREHARIVRKLTGWYIQDLESTNGTRVNNVPVHRRARLRDGDVITIGLVRDARGLLLAPTSRTTTISTKFRSASGDAPAADAGQPVIGATFIFRK